MPRPQARLANNPVTLAETVLAKLDSEPGPCVVFLHINSCEKIAPKCYLAAVDGRPESPMADRARRSPSMVEVGTYTRHIHADDLANDILYAMGEL